jgi:hypothetical protein
MHRDPRIYQTLRQRMTDAGLRDVDMVQLQIPIGAWSTGNPFLLLHSSTASLVFFDRRGNRTLETGAFLFATTLQPMDR